MDPTMNFHTTQPGSGAATRRRLLRPTLAVVAAAALALASPPSQAAIEEPVWRQELAQDAFEIRIVEPYVVAEVTVDGPRERADGEAFRLLFGYISGRNDGSRRIEMTAPVTRAAATAPAASGIKIEMTAPVTSRALAAAPAAEAGAAASAERYVVQFVLPPSLYRSLADAPAPTDARVRLREVPRHRLAVWRYRGSWSEANTADKLAQLRAALAASGIEPPAGAAAQPVLARYDPPLVPWFLRRNEIWIDLGAVGEDDGTKADASARR
jgi:hypothetical protein